MKKTLRRIAPLKMGMFAGVFYALFSLIIIPFFLLAAVLSMFAPNHDDLAQRGLGIGFGLIMCIFMPVIYGVLGFIFGALGALLYNLIASWIGGIEVEVD